MDAKYDIFRRLSDDQPVWMKAVEGLEEAKLEVTQMARAFPGEYFIFDARNGSVISVGRSSFLATSSQLGLGLST